MSHQTKVKLLIEFIIGIVVGSGFIYFTQKLMETPTQATDIILK